MGILDDLRKNLSINNASSASPEINKAEESYRNAENATKEAVQALGRAIYETDKNNPESKYSDEIKKIKQCIEDENLRLQYRLSLEGKVRCDSCGAVITSDSAFCNKCGSPIPEKDFSSLGVGAPVQPESPGNIVCPKCGSTMQQGISFCMKCGTKLDGSGDNSSPVVESQTNKESQTNNNICPQCGAPLVEDAIFCEKCGASLK